MIDPQMQCKTEETRHSHRKLENHMGKIHRAFIHFSLKTNYFSKLGILNSRHFSSRKSIKRFRLLFNLNCKIKPS